MTSTMLGWWPAYGIYLISQADLFPQSEEKKSATPLWSITSRLTRPQTGRCMSHSTGTRLRLALKLIGSPTRAQVKSQTTNCQSTLRKTNHNKTKKADDNVTAAVPFAEGTQLLELSALQFSMDRKICSKTWMKQAIMFSTVL